MEKQENKGVSVMGTVIGIAIIGSVVCGVFECFGVNSGCIGGVFCIVPVVFLAGFVVWQIINSLEK